MDKLEQAVAQLQVQHEKQSQQLHTLRKETASKRQLAQVQEHLTQHDQTLSYISHQQEKANETLNQLQRDTASKDDVIALQNHTERVMQEQYQHVTNVLASLRETLHTYAQKNRSIIAYLAPWLDV